MRIAFCRAVDGKMVGGARSSLRSKRFRLVSEQRILRKGTFGLSVLTAREMKREPKSERGGRGRKETLADKPLDFEILRSPANEAPDWLG